jgi:nitrous oxide reductase
MKIEKFNDSYRGDKIIKIFKKNTLNDYYQKKDDYETQIDELNKLLKNSKNEILKNINEYISFNKDYFSKKYNLVYYNNNLSFDNVIDFSFFIDEKETPKMSIITKYDKIFIKYDDIESLLKFLDDPDFYKDTTKYNL